MLNGRTYLALATLVACGGSNQNEVPKRPMSVAQHEAAAQEHDEEAEAHERLYQPAEERTSGQPIECIDQPLAGIPYSGTEPMQVMRPCWTADQNPTTHHLREAARHREEAARHRGEAKKLLGAEQDACAGLGEDAIAHSPFFHDEDIVSLEPVREDGVVRGFRAVFREVPGLSAGWLERAVRCHQTRAAVMGYSSTFMPYCPITVGPNQATVKEGEAGIIVVLTSEKSEVAAAMLGRARDLVSGAKEARGE